MDDLPQKHCDCMPRKIQHRVGEKRILLNSSAKQVNDNHKVTDKKNSVMDAKEWNARQHAIDERHGYDHSQFVEQTDDQFSIQNKNISGKIDQ